MGYTHYWTQKHDFTVKEWGEIQTDIRAILDEATKRQVPLGDFMGEAGSKPEFSTECLGFNGIDDDAHETFAINRKRPPKKAWERTRGWAFCKTRQKPYDLAVTACLAYLEAVRSYSVTSDGDAPDWTDGVALARKALPQYPDIAVPKEVLEPVAA